MLYPVAPIAPEPTSVLPQSSEGLQVFGATLSLNQLISKVLSSSSDLDSKMFWI